MTSSTTGENAPPYKKPFDAEETTDPIQLVQDWLRAAIETEPNNPDAAALATATRDAIPSVRMVLIKRVDPEGFRFFTNAESQKGLELAQNPAAALCFYWKTQRRQIRAQGLVHEIPAEDANRYFHTRSRRSQIGAAVSAQSRPLDSRKTLEDAARDLEAQLEGEVPRPAYWRGYCLSPERIEFWQEGDFRLHDRVLFVRQPNGWSRQRLYP